ncbi:FxsA family protein [Rhodococcus hoagii]|uniref:FxsA cytoplasmic membrane protein n=1 Tax=Prescottella equi ATCC 33707 TaxID=525370 RepID=E9T630_RHOHA|nr:FxsA family protein [Prescottella equi]EGD22017.1 FxsA cytoplasmic membrane protein [Prescottella equi ATCC 33707]NKS31693.1 FxsA family protein [Prescottella equi]
MIAALFVLYLVVEVGVLIWVGSTIGVLWTVLLLIAGSAVGMVLVKSQWRAVMAGFRRATRGETSPTGAVADGAMVAAGSVLMFVPGLVTSVLGLLMLLPPTRWALRPVAVLLAGKRANVTLAGVEFASRTAGARRGTVIDGEVVDVDPDFGSDTPTQGPRALP